MIIIAFPLTINKYPMPAINTTLAADSEIRRILGKVPFVKFIGVLYNVFSEHPNNKGEEIANIFGISEKGGKVACRIVCTIQARVFGISAW